MPDTKRGRERKGRNKQAQVRTMEIEAELEPTDIDGFEDLEREETLELADQLDVDIEETEATD